jgi:hypothetical protein
MTCARENSDQQEDSDAQGNDEAGVLARLDRRLPGSPFQCRTRSRGRLARAEERAAEVKQVTYPDWHRVELAIRGFSAEASQLTQKGWRIFH